MKSLRICHLNSRRENRILKHKNKLYLKFLIDIGVNFKNFDEFLNQSTHLYLLNPFNTRYSTNINRTTKKIILKVTDDIHVY